MRVRGGARGVGRCVVLRVAWRPPAACAHLPPPQVKAVEYWMKEAFASPRGHASLVAASEFVHFGVTSEDVSNCAYALLVRDARARVLLPAMRGVVEAVAAAAESLAGAALLSRTHGQPATPTTMGKELAVFAARLSAALKERELLKGEADHYTEKVGKLTADLAAAKDSAKAAARDHLDGNRGKLEAAASAYAEKKAEVAASMRTLDADLIAVLTPTFSRIIETQLRYHTDSIGFINPAVALTGTEPPLELSAEGLALKEAPLARGDTAAVSDSSAP
jgi:hypothetical protein